MAKPFHIPASPPSLLAAPSTKTFHSQHFTILPFSPASRSRPQPTHRLHAPLHHGLDPRLQRLVRTLDVQILQPHARRVLVEPDLDARDRDPQVVQAAQLRLVLGGELRRHGRGGGDRVGRCNPVHGVAVGGRRGRGRQRAQGRGCAREGEGRDGVGAELVFEDEKQAGEAGGRVGRGVGMGLFEAEGEVVFGVCRVGVGMRVLAGGFCGGVSSLEMGKGGG